MCSHWLLPRPAFLAPLVLAALVTAQTQFADLTTKRTWFGEVAGLRLARAGDIDGDNDLDVFVVCSGQNRLYRRDPFGIVRDVTASLLPRGFIASASGTSCAR